MDTKLLITGKALKNIVSKIPDDAFVGMLGADTGGYDTCICVSVDEVQIHLSDCGRFAFFGASEINSREDRELELKRKVSLAKEKLEFRLNSKND